MTGHKIKFLFALVLFGSVSLHAVTIPQDKQIESKVVATFSAPKENPMHMPTDVATDSSGRIFAADGANNRIIRFTPAGKIDLVISQKFSHPVGIEIKNDQLWIADTGNHRLVLTTTDGKLIRTIALPEKEKDHPASPTDVAVTPDGKRAYVVDNANHRILIIDVKTGLFSVMGEFGKSIGQFEWPFMICLGNDNYTYVSEAIGARIQRISPKDKWAGTVGQYGIQLGQLYRPKGVAIDASGKLFISDSTLNAIQVFDADGTAHGVLTGNGNILRFAHPMGMTFNREGKLLVTELEADRIAVVNIAKAKGDAR